MFLLGCMILSAANYFPPTIATPLPFSLPATFCGPDLDPSRGARQDFGAGKQRLLPTIVLNWEGIPMITP